MKHVLSHLPSCLSPCKQTRVARPSSRRTSRGQAAEAGLRAGLPLVTSLGTIALCC